MKVILVNNCLRCPFSHFTLTADDKHRMHLYCGHHDKVITVEANTYDGEIPEWCELADYYERNDDDDY